MVANTQYTVHLSQGAVYIEISAFYIVILHSERQSLRMATSVQQGHSVYCERQNLRMATFI